MNKHASIHLQRSVDAIDLVLQVVPLLQHIPNSQSHTAVTEQPGWKISRDRKRISLQRHLIMPPYQNDRR